MSLVANFSSSESLSSPSQVTFTDISTGSDNTITARHIYIRLANGNYLTTAGESTTAVYEVWNYSDPNITLSLLSQSTTANVTVVWLAGSTPVYTKTILTIWDLYDYLFMFGLIQTQTSAPTIISDTNYYSNYLAMIVNIFSAENAVTLMDDLYSSQGALDKNQFLITNANFAF